MILKIEYTFLNRISIKGARAQNIVLKSTYLKGKLSDSFTNYNYVGNTKVSVSIKKTKANKCTLSEIFLTEI